MRNIIQDCLDYDKPLAMLPQVKQFLNYIFSRPSSLSHYHILTAQMQSFISIESPIKEFGKFFVSKEHQEINHPTLMMEFGLPPWAI
jgi:hypothetical protein